MNAEFRELAAAGCPLIQVEEPPHHGRSTRPDCTDADLEFLTEAFNRQLVGVDTEIWAHTCWGNPNQQRVYWKTPSYERALPYLLQLDADVITFECASSDGMDLPLFAKHKTDKKIGIGVISHCNTVVEPPEHVAGLIRRRSSTSRPSAWWSRPTAASVARAQPADRLLQVRGAGGGHEHRPPRARAARGARPRRRPQALVRELTRPAVRIGRAPSATEIVCALGAEPELVGISHECDFPAGVTGLRADARRVARRREPRHRPRGPRRPEDALASTRSTRPRWPSPRPTSSSRRTSATSAPSRSTTCGPRSPGWPARRRPHREPPPDAARGRLDDIVHVAARSPGRERVRRVVDARPRFADGH